MRNDVSWNTLEIPIIDKDGFPAWIDRFPMWKIEQMKEEAKAQGLLTSFYQEYMLQIMADDDALFKPEYFQYKSHSDMPDDLEFYITCDLAISNAKTADRTAFVVNGVDTANNWHIVNVFAERGVTPTEQAKKLISLIEWCYSKNRKVPMLGVEMVSYQKSFMHSYELEVSKRTDIAHYLPYIQELKADAKKERRIQQLETVFKRKMVYFYKQSTIPLLEEELLMFPRARHDDIADALAYQFSLVKPRVAQSEYLDVLEQEMLMEISW